MRINSPRSTGGAKNRHCNSTDHKCCRSAWRVKHKLLLVMTQREAGRNWRAASRSSAPSARAAPCRASNQRHFAGDTGLSRRHLLRRHRFHRVGMADPLDIWAALGMAEPNKLPMLEAEAFVVAAAPHRLGAN